MKKNKKILEKPYFTTSEAQKSGISRRMLSYYVKTGEIERIRSGFYTSPSHRVELPDVEWLDLAVAANSIDGGVICLISALVYYGLTDEIMNKLWVAVDHSRSEVKHPGCRVIRMRNMELGIESIYLSGMKVKIFDKERTIVDSFRLLDEEVAIKALKEYMRQSPNLSKLSEYATKMRVSQFKKYIKVLSV